MTFNVLDNDTDEQDNIVASLTTALTSPSGGALTHHSDGTFTFNPNGDFEYLPAGQSTTVSFDYQIADSFGETDDATVTITVNGVNDAASISGDNVGTLTEDEAGDSGVMAVSDVDDGEGAFQTQSGTAGTYGNFSIDAAGNWSYDRTAALQTLAVGESVSDNFTVVSTDGTATENLTVTITGENDVPVVANDGNVTVNEGQTAANSGTWSDIDTSDVVALSASLGTVTKNTNGTWDWNFAASDGPDESQSVVITASDGNGGVSTTSFDLTVNNVAPTANADNDSVFEDGAASVLALLDNDTDPAGANDPLTITGVNTAGAVGTVTLSGSEVSYSPNGQFESLAAGETATDSFSYTISDGDGDSDTATVSITVVGQNDAPTVVNAVSDVEVNQNAADTMIDVSGVFDDVDNGDTVTVTVASSDSGVVTASVSGGTLTLDYQPNQNGSVTITVTGTDSQGASVTTSFEVVVLSPADQIDRISDVIQQLVDDNKINKGQANALRKKLAAALKQIESGRKNSISTAVNQIGAFQNQVDALERSGKITGNDADLLNDLTNELIDSLFV